MAGRMLRAYICICSQDGHGVVQAGDQGVSHTSPACVHSQSGVIDVSNGGWVAAATIAWRSTSNSCSAQSALSKTGTQGI